MDKTYPTGTKIRFINSCCKKGKGKIGKIVSFSDKGYPVILIPECTCTSVYSTLSCHASVQCSWDCIEILIKKNQQLLFSFME